MAVDEIEEPLTAEGVPEMARIKSLWREFLDKVNAKNRALHGVLKDTHPKSCETGTLVLACLGPFHREQVEKPENKKLIEALLEETTGLKLNLVPVLAEEKKTGIVSPPGGGVLKPMGRAKTDLREMGKQEPFVEAVVKLFNGKVVDVKRTRPNNGS